MNDMAYEPLSTFDFSKLFVPIEQAREQIDISAKAKKTGASLVEQGKEFVRTYPQRTKEHLASLSPITPEGKFDVEKAANLAGGFVGGGMRNVAKPLFTKAVEQYRYHETPISNLERIKSRGLVPHTAQDTGATGVFFSITPEMRSVKDGSSILLRAEKSDLEKLSGYSDEAGGNVHYNESLGTGEGGVNAIINPQLLEYTTNGVSWKPLIDSSKLVSIKPPSTVAPFTGFKDYSTNVLEALKGKSVVNKQQIVSEINRIAGKVGMKTPEKNLYTEALFNSSKGDVVDVNEFANEVKNNLIPLKLSHPIISSKGNKYLRWEGITLPSEQRGPVANYSEHIYESPIKTSAGEQHFSSQDYPNYFAHTRVEDLPSKKAASKIKSDPFDQTGDFIGDPESGFRVDKSILKGSGKGDTRRIIEVQSDLMQKGRLENETKEAYLKGYKDYEERLSHEEGINKLKQYESTWFQPVIRSELKQAAKDGKKFVQFPTGETAMKIEGLGREGRFQLVQESLARDSEVLATKDNIKVGLEVIPANDTSSWIITDVLGDGKFKATTKNNWESSGKGKFLNPFDKETFDISGKVDTTHGVYMKYEDMGKWLKNRLGAKEITDTQGVKWYQVEVKPEQAKQPIIMHGGTNLKTLVGGTIAATGIGSLFVPSKSVYEQPENISPQTIYNFTRAIASNETEGKKNPYSFRQFSGRKDLGDALGRYQVTEGELKLNSEKFLGKKVSPLEFLTSQNLQDKYIREKYLYYTKLGYTPQQIADIHNKGFRFSGEPGSTTYQNPKYVKDFDEVFNSKP